MYALHNKRVRVIDPLPNNRRARGVIGTASFWANRAVGDITNSGEVHLEPHYKINPENEVDQDKVAGRIFAAAELELI